jgi:CrcB protein
MDLFWVGLGAVFGANSRYLITQAVADRLGTAFPYGTMLVNITGSLIIGFLLTLLAEQFLVSPHWRLLLVVGFLGSYTTFSSYTYEAVGLIERSEWSPALVYMLGSNIAGLLACYGGIVLARLAER